ncbi:MAG: hypothetical protein K1X44_07435 [Alphaproteobacteria bacterium]|nr:hypothetical protein [Alphaproteobacteria bacterium]
MQILKSLLLSLVFLGLTASLSFAQSTGGGIKVGVGTVAGAKSGSSGVGGNGAYSKDGGTTKTGIKPGQYAYETPFPPLAKANCDSALLGKDKGCSQDHTQ